MVEGSVGREAWDRRTHSAPHSGILWRSVCVGGIDRIRTRGSSRPYGFGSGRTPGWSKRVADASGARTRISLLPTAITHFPAGVFRESGASPGETAMNFPLLFSDIKPSHTNQLLPNKRGDTMNKKHNEEQPQKLPALGFANFGHISVKWRVMMSH